MRSVTSSVTTSARAAPRDDDDDDDYVSDMNTTRPPPALFAQVDTRVDTTRMWANAQRDGRPAECRWRPLFNAAKFG